MSETVKLNSVDFFKQIEILETENTALKSELEALKATPIKFADWLDKLSPSEKVSVWSKDGQYKGLFNMDNEQLFEKFKREITK